MSKFLNIVLVIVIVLFSGIKMFFTPQETILLYTPDHQLRHQKVIFKLPDDLTFAGESIHFKTPDAYLKYYRELKVNTANNSSTRLMMKNVNTFLPLIEQVLIENKVPKDFKYLAVAESNLTHQLKSAKGAAGIWQFTQATAEDYGLEVNDEVDERYHLLKSTAAAAKYFKIAHRLFGTWTSAAASYNRGIGGLQKAFKNQSVNSYYDLALNRETARYIFKILALKDLISSPKKYKMTFFRPRQVKLQYFKVDSTITDLVEYSRHLGIEYEVLKEKNPWLLKNSLTIKEEGRVYYLAFPASVPKLTPVIADTNRSKEHKGYTRNKNVFKNKYLKGYNT